MTRNRALSIVVYAQNRRMAAARPRARASNGNSGRAKADLDISLFAPSAPSRSLRRQLPISEFEVHKNARNERGLGERKEGKGGGTENENKVRMWRAKGATGTIAIGGGGLPPAFSLCEWSCVKNSGALFAAFFRGFALSAPPPLGTPIASGLTMGRREGRVRQKSG